MILVFIILGIIILINLFFLIILLSNVKFKIKKLYISNEGKRTQVEFILELGIYAFNKFKIVKYTLDDIKIKNLIKNGNIDIKKIKDNNKLNKDFIKTFKNLKLSIELFEIDGYFATFNAVISGKIYVLLNSILPILLAPKINGKYINNLQFLNIEKNIINVNAKCIINVKIVNIINILQSLKNRGGKVNNGKSSNRRTYAYSNE